MDPDRFYIHEIETIPARPVQLRHETVVEVLENGDDLLWIGYGIRFGVKRLPVRLRRGRVGVRRQPRHGRGRAQRRAHGRVRCARGCRRLVGLLLTGAQDQAQ